MPFENKQKSGNEIKYFKNNRNCVISGRLNYEGYVKHSSNLIFTI